jgi:hypothetical protein
VTCTTDTLNIFYSPQEELRAAFDLMEGEGFFDESMGTTHWSGCTLLDFLLWHAEQEGRFCLQGDRRDLPCHGPVVYGSGGLHRYFIGADGTIWYSWRHGAYKDKDAEAVGFRIFK